MSRKPGPWIVYEHNGGARGKGDRAYGPFTNQHQANAAASYMNTFPQTNGTAWVLELLPATNAPTWGPE